jgi:hypothetical protein
MGFLCVSYVAQCCPKSLAQSRVILDIILARVSIALEGLGVVVMLGYGLLSI